MVVRKMSGHRTSQRVGYQCRIREQYAFQADDHPRTLFVSERNLATVTAEWPAGPFDDNSRDAVLRDAEQRRSKVVEAVGAGLFEAAETEAAATLGRLRAQRDSAKATPAAAEREPVGLTADDIVGGLRQLLRPGRCARLGHRAL